MAGPTAGPVPPGFPPKVHYTPTAPAGTNPTVPYNYNMMLDQSNVTPTGPPSQPTSITVQTGNVGLTAMSGQATTIPHAFTTETLRDFSNGAWNMDTCASSHLNSSVNSLCEIFNTYMYPPISVGDGHSIPVTNRAIFVRDNNCTIEFDAFGFSVKDFMTRRVLLRCDSTRDLYLVTHPFPIPRAFLVSQHTWHQRLGHPGGDVLRLLVSNNVISCNNEKPPVLYHACQLGKHVRLPFISSNTVITSCFEIIHSDVWTSPIPSLSGFKY
ncbi:ribonuclease H-like domain-containing protein [Tanacetum coccineum]